MEMTHEQYKQVAEKKYWTGIDAYKRCENGNYESELLKITKDFYIIDERRRKDTSGFVEEYLDQDDNGFISIENIALNYKNEYDTREEEEKNGKIEVILSVVDERYPFMKTEEYFIEREDFNVEKLKECMVNFFSKFS